MLGEGAELSEEPKEKRSFDDILWNTFIVIMVIFLGYALLLPRIHHVVERIQGKKPAVVANAAPAQSAPEPETSVPAAQPSDTSSTPPASSTEEAKAPSSNPAPSAGDGASPAATAPHVKVNPPPAAHVSPESREKTKPRPVTKPGPASKTPVQTPPFQARYAVDAGSYTVRSNADRLISEIPGKYQPHTTITPVTVRGRLFYRVRIVVATKAEADELSAELLRKEKVHAVILPLR
jgi:cytoskeletal protein RodZ